MIQCPHVCMEEASRPQMILMARIEVFNALEARSDEMHFNISKCSPVVERDSFLLADLL